MIRNTFKNKSNQNELIKYPNNLTVNSLTTANEIFCLVILYNLKYLNNALSHFIINYI